MMACAMVATTTELNVDTMEGTVSLTSTQTKNATDQFAPRGPTKVAPGARLNASTKEAAAKLMI